LVIRAVFVPERELPPPEFSSVFDPLHFPATLDPATGIITCDNAGMSFLGDIRAEWHPDQRPAAQGGDADAAQGGQAPAGQDGNARGRLGGDDETPPDGQHDRTSGVGNGAAGDGSGVHLHRRKRSQVSCQPAGMAAIPR
jgi:hypothetical protein